jgi:hypothetical protein
MQSSIDTLSRRRFLAGSVSATTGAKRAPASQFATRSSFASWQLEPKADWVGFAEPMKAWSRTCRSMMRSAPTPALAPVPARAGAGAGAGATSQILLCGGYWRSACGS